MTEMDGHGGRVNGQWVKWSSLTPSQRRRLVAPDGGSMLLAVRSDGGPFTAWSSLFERTSRLIAERYEPRFPHVHPHRCRHTMAMATMERLVAGYYELPPGGRCDLKTLAAEAGVTRTGFYPKKDRDGSIREGPYQHLGDEFVRRLAALREAGEMPDPRDAQIERLKAQNAELKDRVADRDKTIAALTEFKKLAQSRLAAQHDEIMHLRNPQPPPAPTPLAQLSPVPRARTAVIGPCG